jgi:glucose/mannose transport system substrate-binding protein
MKRSFISAALVCAVLGIGSGGCGSDSGSGGEGGSGGQNQGETVELFSWWIAPGEAEALQALVDVYRAEFPKTHIFNAAAASGDNARALLKDRLATNRPPDLFQENAPALRTFIASNPDKLLALDTLFDSLDLRQTVLPEVIKDVTTNGKIYAMPINLHRENSLFYNKTIFTTHNVTPPTTLQGFLDACAKLKAAGVTPVATAHQGWILRIMWNSIAMASMGPAQYRDYMTGKTARNDAALNAAIDVFANVVQNYTNASASNKDFGWTNAAQAVYNGEAAMFLHGDWAKGYFVQLGWTPGVDFGVVGMPGASEMFLYGVDTFALPKGAAHSTLAEKFLGVVASKTGQLAFNKLKGSSPIRLDVAKDQLDGLGQATLRDLETASIRMLVPAKDEWDAAMLAFAQNKDKAALFQAFVTTEPTAQ